MTARFVKDSGPSAPAVAGCRENYPTRRLLRFREKPVRSVGVSGPDAKLGE